MTQTAKLNAGCLEGAGATTTDLLGIYDAIRQEILFLGDALDAC